MFSVILQSSLIDELYWQKEVKNIIQLLIIYGSWEL